MCCPWGGVQHYGMAVLTSFIEDKYLHQLVTQEMTLALKLKKPPLKSQTYKEVTVFVNSKPKQVLSLGETDLCRLCSSHVDQSLSTQFSYSKLSDWPM